jgi:hypothetical protein
MPNVIPTGYRGEKQHYNLTYIGMPCIVSEEDPEFSAFFQLLKRTVANERRMFIVDGRPTVACINWLRDHVQMMKAFKHWEHDLKGYLDFAVANQTGEGFFYEIVSPSNDDHGDFPLADCLKRLPEDELMLVRIEAEADIEYLVVEGVFQAYKATGDLGWIEKILPGLERAIAYDLSSPKRWDAGHGLVKRPFTIDTWDFVYTQDPQAYGGRSIHKDTPMSIMHGDNSGVYQAMLRLAFFNRKLGNEAQAGQWLKKAGLLKERLNHYCWNGRFYTHQLHLNHGGCPERDETEVLSLSNAYDINRGVTAEQQAKSIIEEYQSRRKTTDKFAEWFTVDPPYPVFYHIPENKYINGAIASFTAGELAKAAFQHGYEDYGYDIVKRLRALVERDKELYFLYDPYTGRDLGGGPSGWGAAAILSAIEEGLAGIADRDCLFETLDFSPRWAVTEFTKIKYVTGYEVSQRLIETIYQKTESGMLYVVSAPSREINCHILLPAGTACREVLLNGKSVRFTVSQIEESKYVDFAWRQNEAKGGYGRLRKNLIELKLRKEI